MFCAISHFKRGLLLAFTLLSLPNLADAAPNNCKVITIPVRINVQTPQLPLDLSLNFLSLIGGVVGSLTSLLRLPVTGPFDIVGRYCEPENSVPSRKNTLQLLAHPATYTKDWWSGGRAPGFGYDGERYDWVTYASKQGYPTFAFDRLGNGQSSHPDPILVVQVGVQAATIHEIIKIARQGPTAASAPFPRAFNKIILAGASLGSIVANQVSSLYPADVDAVVLAAFSKVWVNAVPGFIITAGLSPARLVQSNRYGTLPIGYLEASSETGVAFLLFYGPGEYYDPAFIQWDYENRGTISVGEGVTGALGIFQANAYRGKVLVITGQQDVVFCGTDGLRASGVGNCGKGTSSLLEQTKSLYPGVKNYTAYHVPNAGHCWMHQYNATANFKVAHDWLRDNGF